MQKEGHDEQRRRGPPTSTQHVYDRFCTVKKGHFAPLIVVILRNSCTGEWLFAPKWNILIKQTPFKKYITMSQHYMKLSHIQDFLTFWRFGNIFKKLINKNNIMSIISSMVLSFVSMIFRVLLRDPPVDWIEALIEFIKEMTTSKVSDRVSALLEFLCLNGYSMQWCIWNIMQRIHEITRCKSLLFITNSKVSNRRLNSQKLSQNMINPSGLYGPVIVSIIILLFRSTCWYFVGHVSTSGTTSCL